MENKAFAKNAVLFQEGDVADVAYFITSGKIETVQSGHGLAEIKKLFGENEIVGEVAVFDSQALRPYTARAIEDTKLIPISSDALTRLSSGQPPEIQALLQLAFDRMKQNRAKTIDRKSSAVVTGIKKITVKPVGEKMSALFKPVEVSPGRLPFRIGGYPEGGEVNRRDTLHLSIPSQANPLRVSRQHCEIGLEEETLTLTDLGSRFATIVNGVPIGRGRGRYSQPLKMGENTLTLGAAQSGYSFTIICE